MAISERARREVAAASSADTARQKWRQRPEVCSLTGTRVLEDSLSPICYAVNTSTRRLSSVRRLALADMRRGELVDGERPEVEQRGAPPLHTSRALRLGLLALETARAHPPATLEQRVPGEHTVAVPYVTTKRLARKSARRQAGLAGHALRTERSFSLAVADAVAISGCCIAVHIVVRAAWSSRAHWPVQSNTRLRRSPTRSNHALSHAPSAARRAHTFVQLFHDAGRKVQLG